MVLSSTTISSVSSFIIFITRSSALLKLIFLMQSGPIFNLHCKFSGLSQEQSVGLQYVEQTAEAQSTFLSHQKCWISPDIKGEPWLCLHNLAILSLPRAPQPCVDGGALLSVSELGHADLIRNPCMILWKTLNDEL